MIRTKFAAVAVALPLVILACSDVAPPSAVEPLGVPGPSFDHVQGAVHFEWAPGKCVSPYDALPLSWAHDDQTAASAEAADVNGNTNICIDRLNELVVEVPYQDDTFRCADGETPVFLGVPHPLDVDDPDDPKKNGVLCIDDASGIAFDDCTLDELNSDLPGVPGDGGDGGDLPGVPGFSLGVPSSDLDTEGVGSCDRPAEYDDFGEAFCPAGFEPPFPFEHEADANGNGLVCWSDGVFVDDLVGLTLTAGKVNGHGVYEAQGALLSFSFHARSDGETVKGNFEFHDRTAGTTYHGDVTCLEADGSTVHLEGVLSNAKKNADPEGTAVAWTATDHGEGKKAPADRVSAPETFGPFVEACSVRPTNPTVEIRGGNVQVK